MVCCWLARGVRGGGGGGEGRTTRRKMASKESKRPCGAARAGTAGGGGRARPRHAPAKGANWREEQGAGPGARLGARLEGPTRDGTKARRAPSTSGARRGASGPRVGPPSPPTPPPLSLPPPPAAALPSAPLALGRRRPPPPESGHGCSFHARASIASGSRPLSGGFWNTPAYGC